MEQVLIDELGRGTSHEDGVALSVALCEQFIYQESRTIMTTHIHELTTLLQRAHKEKVQMLCTEVLVRMVIEPILFFVGAHYGVYRLISAAELFA